MRVVTDDKTNNVAAGRTTMRDEGLSIWSVLRGADEGARAKEEVGRDVFGGCGGNYVDEVGIYRELSLLYGRQVTPTTVRVGRRLVCMRPVLIDLSEVKSAAVTPVDADRERVMEVSTVDVSPRGLGLRAAGSVGLGRRFSIELEVPKGRLAVMYRVCFEKPLLDGQWRVGAERVGLIARPGLDGPEHVMMALLMGSCPGVSRKMA